MKIGTRTPFIAVGIVLSPVLSCGWAHAGYAHLRQSVQIPMRDAPYTLAANVYLPAASGQWPAVLIQTPYNKDLFAPVFVSALGTDPLLESPDYAFLVLDWRGFYGSASSAYGGSPSHGEDGYDAVEWIAAQSWCTGNVGTWGASALGNVQMKTAAEQPPHLRCCVPMVYHFREWYDQAYPGGIYATSRNTFVYGLYGGLALVRAHPLHDTYWSIAEQAGDVTKINVPMLHVSGWFDHETEQTIREMQAVQSQGGAAARGLQKLIIGPWTHQGIDAVTQGQLSFPAAQHAAAQAALECFDHYLRGISNSYLSRPTISRFRINDDAWNPDETWPPTGTVSTPYYLTLSGGLTTAAPTGATGQLQYVSNPADPVPTLFGAVLDDPSASQGPGDLTPVLARPDVLVFSTDVLSKPLTIDGVIRAHLFVTCTAVDTDLSVRLMDVLPAGDERSMVLVDGALRASLRDGFSVKKPLVAGTVYALDAHLSPVNVTFPAGHRLRIVVSSSNYDRYDKNMQDGSDLSDETGATATTATVTVQANAQYASRIDLPVVPAQTEGEPEPLTVDFSAAPVSGRPPLVVQFQGTATGPGVDGAEWFWEFGDGETLEDNDAQPVHTYTRPGQYTVSATVTTATDSGKATKTNFVVVDEQLSVDTTITLLAMTLLFCAGMKRSMPRAKARIEPGRNP